MGIAAYNRGSAKISRDLDADIRPVTFEIMERLDKLPRGSGRLMDSTVIRVDNSDRWWLMNRRDRGWAEFGLFYPNARALFADWAIIVTGTGRDGCSLYYTVKNA